MNLVVGGLSKVPDPAYSSLPVFEDDVSLYMVLLLGHSAGFA